MRTSRRSVIKLGLYATASFITFFEGLSDCVALAAGQSQAPVTDDGLWLRRDMFEAVVGERFVVRKPRGGSIAMRLIRVEDVPSARNASTVNHPDCYIIGLSGSTSSQLAEGTYLVESSTLGTFLLFIVPGLPTSAGITYTATFNRVQPQ
jgi:Domain of unknown function (DUF6916)